MRPVKIKEVIDFRFQAKVSGRSSGRTQVQLVNFYKSRGTEKGKLCHVMFRLPTFWRCSATCLFTAIVLLENNRISLTANFTAHCTLLILNTKALFFMSNNICVV